MIARNAQTHDALAGPERYAINLPAFEGPLDLLLFLVRKQEVDIYDIPIHTVTRQYLDILKDMQRMNLEVAGEFFVMAATLMQIKSAMLLPKDEAVVNAEDEEEAGDPRWQLVEQLLEYQKFKDAAHSLDGLISEAQDYIPRRYLLNQAQELDKPLTNSDKIELWNVFNVVLRRLAEQIHGAGEIHDESVSVAERMECVLERIHQTKSFTFSSLFEKGFTLTHIVATFLAILELTRLKKITLAQEENFTDIRITALEQSEELTADVSEQEEPEEDFEIDRNPSEDLQS